MASLNTYNFIDFIENNLSNEIKRELTENIIKEQMEVVEEELRKNIKPLIESITLSKIEHLMKYDSSFREFKLYVEMKGN